MGNHRIEFHGRYAANWAKDFAHIARTIPGSKVRVFRGEWDYKSRCYKWYVQTGEISDEYHKELCEAFGVTCINLEGIVW